MTSKTEICQNCKNQFNIEPEDFKFYEKISVPPPTFCPECRLQRRLMFRNERVFYKRSCDLCKKDIIAVYPQNAPFPVYCVKCWWSDKWDPLQYGREFNFSETFAKQYRTFLDTMPQIAIMNDNGIASVNSEYTYDFFFSKNCYLTVCGWHSENSMYAYHADYVKDVVDCAHTDHSEMLYECVGAYNCFGLKYCNLCYDSYNCIFGLDLRGCSECFMCVGLRNKQYYIQNKPYTKEEYKRKLQEIDIGNRNSVTELKKQFAKFILRFVHKYAIIHRSVNTTGHVLDRCKNARHCFYSRSVEDGGFMLVNDASKDCYDCNNTGKPQLCYESVTCDQSYGCLATVFCTQCNQVEYSMDCHSSEHCFGCSGLKKGTYTVLNKRYAKDDYIHLRDRIIAHMKDTGEWGEFLPPSVSPFAYNETAAHEWFPLLKEQVIQIDYRWKDPEERNYQITMKTEDIPDHIKDVDDSILEQVIECAHHPQCNENCTTAFRIIKPELEFLRKMNLLLPRLCPNCRHYQRLKQRNPLKLWQRTCQCNGENSSNGIYQNTIKHFHQDQPCPNEFETSYAPEREEIVYCEQCYLQEIV